MRRPFPDGERGFDPALLYIGGGVLVGLGVAAGSFGIVLAAFARNVSAGAAQLRVRHRHRGRFGRHVHLRAAGPGPDLAYGWSDTLVYMAIDADRFRSWPFRWRQRQDGGRNSQADSEQTDRPRPCARRSATAAICCWSTGFFVCGFQVAFITVHFPAYIRDIGIDARYAVIALALIGFFNIIGSLASG
jgi:hypothetical protein